MASIIFNPFFDSPCTFQEYFFYIYVSVNFPNVVKMNQKVMLPLDEKRRQCNRVTRSPLCANKIQSNNYNLKSFFHASAFSKFFQFLLTFSVALLGIFFSRFNLNSIKIGLKKGLFCGRSL